MALGITPNIVLSGALSQKYLNAKLEGPFLVIAYARCEEPLAHRVLAELQLPSSPRPLGMLGEVEGSCSSETSAWAMNASFLLQHSQLP